MELFLNQDIAASVLKMCTVDTAVNLGLAVLRNKQLRAIGADDRLWDALLRLHFGPPRAYVPLVAFPVVPELCDIPSWRADDDDLPQVARACKEFVETTLERRIFASMTVLRGNIGTIETLDGARIDCFIFPTNPSLRNHRIGAAAAIFERAGPQLDDHVEEGRPWAHRHYEASEAIVTPGFDSGADHLIHCIGPYWRMPNASVRLYDTYLHAFEEARRVGAKVVVVASISTGSLGFPVPEAATIAMAAYRDAVKGYRWRARVGFICYESTVFDEFSKARTATLDRFNDVALRSVGDDEVLWQRLQRSHFGETPLEHELRTLAIMTKQLSACDAFFDIFAARAIFEAMTVVRGDIGRISAIDDQPLDCLIFPTNSSLLSFGVGAAGAVFNRAGKELPAYLRNPEFRNTRWYVTDAVATPGFKAGVNHLIHCIGPSTNRPDCASTLYRTYLNAFERAREVGATCIAVASISTGSLGFPVAEAAVIAMRVYRDYVRAYRWRARLCFVCYEDRVFNAMQTQRTAVLCAFNQGTLALPLA
ncbi:hypothetical protein ACHHYP_10771 [Achlya hypogyna]|uniref:Macro domain-containing protein n=1 Tax=Achlya hypogyna TaxID=1202772 RepID=A0A1V9YKN3_ACHHY|nr:hypothetical protein ACHHYP_10771 [Achlya hypogyna]